MIESFGVTGGFNASVMVADEAEDEATKHAKAHSILQNKLDNFQPEYYNALTTEQQATLKGYQKKAAVEAEAATAYPLDQGPWEKAKELVYFPMKKEKEKKRKREKNLSQVPLHTERVIKAHQCHWPQGNVFVLGSEVAAKTERIMTEETKTRM